MLTPTQRRTKIARAEKHLATALALLDEVHADFTAAVALDWQASSDQWRQVTNAAGSTEAAVKALGN